MALPPGITPKTVTVGPFTNFDGTVCTGRVTIGAPENVLYIPTGAPLVPNDMVQQLKSDGTASFMLCPTDAAGLNRKDWTYRLTVEISGASKQLDVRSFPLPTAGPDGIDLDSLVTVPSSAGTPISATVVTSVNGQTGDVTVAGGSGGSLTPTATKTTAYTVAVGELAVMNVAGGATALTLPTAPADKAQVGYRAVGATTAVPLVVTAGGTDTIGDSGATSVSLPLSGEVTVYQYQASGTRWLPVANVKPLTALDARYPLASTLGATVAADATVRAALGSAFAPANSVIQAQQWRTTNDQASLLAPVTPAAFAPVTAATFATPPIIVRPNEVFQEFQGAGASITDSSAFVLMNYLDQDARTTLLTDLFSASAGNFTTVRVPLGGSDFNAVPQWSLDDQPIGALSAATTVGATSITSTISIPAGSTVLLDTNANQESFVSGTPTGAGPYTIPLASGSLTLAHASNARLTYADYLTGTATAAITSGTFTATTKFPAGSTLIVDSGSAREHVYVLGSSGSASPYTITAASMAKSHASGTVITSMPGFTLAREMGVQLPLLREILAINPHVKVILSPWTMPNWMKTSLNVVAGSTVSTWMQASCDYLVQAVLAFQAAGIPVWALTPQNEPFNAGWNDYTDADYATFVTALRATCDAMGLDTKILINDHHWSKVPDVQAVLSAINGAQGCDGVAWHGYAGVPQTTLPVMRAYPQLSYHMTEMRTLQAADWQGSTKTILDTAIMASLRYGASTVTLWNLALDEGGKPVQAVDANPRRGVVTVPKAGTGVVKGPDYYCLQHLTRFVQPGARRIESTVYRESPTSGYGNGEQAVGIQTIAFKNPDGSIALICHNLSGQHSTTIPIIDDRTQRAMTVTLAPYEVSTFVWGKTSTPTIQVAPAATVTPVAPASPPALLGTVGNKSDGSAATKTTFFTFTVPAGGTNTMLVVDVAAGATATTEAQVQSVLWGTPVSIGGAGQQPLRFLGRADSGGSFNTPSTTQRVIERWYLLAPTAGTYRVYVNMTAPVPVSYTAYVLGNVNQTKPFRQNGLASSAAGTTTPSVATRGGATTDLVLTAIAAKTATAPSVGGGLTLVGSGAPGGNLAMTVASAAGAVGVVTSGFTYTTGGGSEVNALITNAVVAAA